MARNHDLDGNRVKPGIHWSTGDKRKASGAAATTYSKFDIVVSSAYVDDHPRVAKADASLVGTSRGPLLMLTHDVTVAQTKPKLLLTPWAVVSNVDTSGATLGDPVFLSDTAGGWSLSAGTVRRVVGRVIRVDASTGAWEFNGAVDADLGSNDVAKIISGSITVAAGASSGTAAVGTAYNGKPVTAVVSQAAADGTFTHVVRAIVAAGTLTVYGPANATANTNVTYIIDGR